MKRYRNLLILALVLMLLCSAPSMAASPNRVKTLKTNTWFNIPNTDSADNYKLKLNADSIVTFSWRRCTDYVGLILNDSPSGGGYLYQIEAFTAKGSQAIALSKGTYYIAVEQVGPDDEPPAQGKFTVEKAVNQKNYSRSTAISLASGKTLKIAQTPANSYDRWYKIKLNKTQVITVATNAGNGKRVTIYNAKGRKLACKTSSRETVTKSKYKAGTYYIRVATPNAFGQDGANQESYERVGRVQMVSWK